MAYKRIKLTLAGWEIHTTNNQGTRLVEQSLSEGRASLGDYDRLIDDWQCSAAALADTERTEALSPRITPDDFAEMERPSA